MAGKRRRSGVLKRPYNYDNPEYISRNRSALLDAMNGFYAAALDRLPVEEMPELIPRLLKAGLCFGFSDPVSNIILNTISLKKRKPATGGGGKAAARRRRKALARVTVDTTDVPWYAPMHRDLRGMNLPVRSLEALVAFLVSYFPYLPTWEALQYLRLAKADLLTAVRLVQEDRNSSAFSFASQTTKAALRCGALAAWHPKPRALVRMSYSLASRMDEVSQILSTESCLSCADVESLHGLLRHKPGSHDIARAIAPQFLRKKNKSPPFVRTKSLKNILIDKIYGLYLNVLALLPRDDLRQRYHRGILKAGHCVGPLKNSADNIVLNAVWYETNFPAENEFTVDMICSRSLVCVACRSLCGLVAFLRTCFRTISNYQAMRYLLLAEVNLWGAIEMARQEGNTMRNEFNRGIGYKAAATAAHHPAPEALVHFFVSTLPTMPFTELTPPLPLITGGIFDVQRLSFLLSLEPSPSYLQVVPVLSERASRFLSSIKQDFFAEQSCIFKKVNAALKKYTHKTMGPEYELHVICGLNSNVVKSGISARHYGAVSSIFRCTSKYSHVNFLASPGGVHSSGAVPILFFAECCNDSDMIDESVCWPITGPPGRCFHCENEGARVVHPHQENYHGCDIDFEEMACDNHSEGITNEHIISYGNLITSSVGMSEEDCIYFDFRRDVKCAKFLNLYSSKTASRHWC